MRLRTIQRAWTAWFAWRPVRLESGDVVWLQWVKWRHHTSSFDGDLWPIYLRLTDPQS